MHLKDCVQHIKLINETIFFLGIYPDNRVLGTQKAYSSWEYIQTIEFYEPKRWQNIRVGY